MRMLTTAKRTEHAAKVAGGGQAVDFRGFGDGEACYKVCEVGSGGRSVGKVNGWRDWQGCRDKRGEESEDVHHWMMERRYLKIG
jgi:hypothetical protein